MVLLQNYYRDLGKFFKSSCYHIDMPDANKARKGAHAHRGHVLSAGFHYGGLYL